MEDVSVGKGKRKVVKERVTSPKEKVKIEKPKGKLPKNAKKESKKGKKFGRKPGALIYISHIPHGFYEEQMTSYFSQFGKVLAATVIRSKKTGNSKGYGYVEFRDEDVAKIAAETMNNYLMFSRIIKCRYIPPEERKNTVRWRRYSPSNFPGVINRKKEIMKKNTAFEKLNQDTYLQKTQAKLNQLKKFFNKKGIDFDFKTMGSDSPSNNQTKTSSTTDSELSGSASSDSGGGTNEQFGILEIDESDNDIHFKTPPQVKKVIKRSLDSPVRPSKKQKTLSKSIPKQEMKEGKNKLVTKKTQIKEETKKSNKKSKTKSLSLKVPQVKTTLKNNQPNRKTKAQAASGSKKKNQQQEKLRSGMKKGKA